MQTQLFIPSRIKVGFQVRSECFTGQLAYIIYYDATGKLRKEKSFNGWIDDTIPTLELDNVPRSGFILNKDVTRDSWSHYSSGRSMIRVYDDRGFEFEITPSNLLFILMNTNCNKRELEGEFIYAWDGKELVLLPANCEEYKAANQFTSLQGKKIGVRDLVPGCIYQTKKQVNLTYLGKYDWYDYNWCDSCYDLVKRYVFIDDTNNLVPLTGLTSLSIKLNELPVDNYVDLLEIMNCSKNISPISHLTLTQLTPTDDKHKVYREFDGLIYRYYIYGYLPLTSDYVTLGDCILVTVNNNVVNLTTVNADSYLPRITVSKEQLLNEYSDLVVHLVNGKQYIQG
jgi:hypothetical protein